MAVRYSVCFVARRVNALCDFVDDAIIKTRFHLYIVPNLLSFQKSQLYKWLGKRLRILKKKNRAYIKDRTNLGHFALCMVICYKYSIDHKCWGSLLRVDILYINFILHTIRGKICLQRNYIIKILWFFFFYLPLNEMDEVHSLWKLFTNVTDLFCLFRYPLVC